MDKYEFGIKADQIKKLAKNGDYETAMKICDAIEWRRVSSVNLLSLVSEIYEKNGDIDKAKEIILLAYERAPIGKRLLYRLTVLSVMQGDIFEAETYYREYYNLAPEDPRQHILRYLILRSKGAPVDALIRTMEAYNNEELDEKWMYELAELYHDAGRSEDCVRMCDNIMLMFGLGPYVQQAIELKTVKEGVPLNEYQADLVNNRSKYESKLRAVEAQYAQEDEDAAAEAMHQQLQEQNADRELRGGMPDDNYSRDEKEEINYPEQEEEPAGAEYPEPEEEPTRDEYSESVIPERFEEKQPEETEEPEAQAYVSQSETVNEPESEEEQDVEEEALVEAEESTETELPTLAELEAEQETEAQKPIYTVNFIVARRSPDDGLETTISLLKQMHVNTGSTNQVAKITAGKLNDRGVTASAAKLAGRDLVVEQAGDLTDKSIDELLNLIDDEPDKRVIVLIDNPIQVKKMIEKYPELLEVFHLDKDPSTMKEEARTEQTEETEQSEKPVRMATEKRPGSQMDIDEFADCAVKYAESIDCVISGKSKLALYERIEIMEEEGIALTEESAIALIEEAADRTENPPLGKKLSGMFTSKYDKEGRLILREESFRV